MGSRLGTEICHQPATPLLLSIDRNQFRPPVAVGDRNACEVSREDRFKEPIDWKSGVAFACLYFLSTGYFRRTGISLLTSLGSQIHPLPCCLSAYRTISIPRRFRAWHAAIPRSRSGSKSAERAFR